jgi:hypothetical protein
MVPELMPNWLLSPRVHFLLSTAADKLGDADMARREQYLAKVCLRGLLASGNGSEELPYLITHLPDEYDVLDALGKEMTGQRLVRSGPGACDVIACADGTEVWFDITAGLQAEAQKHLV